MSHLGAPFCRGVEPFLANLKALLNECARQGVSDFNAVVSAQAVYDDVTGFLLYVPLVGNDCERHTAEVQAAITKVSIVLQAIPGADLSVPRPDAAPSATYGIPDWVKVVAIGGLAVYGLSLVASFIPRSRYSGYRRRSRR